MTSQISERRKELLAAWPKWEQVIRGSLIERTSQCGNPRCRCRRGHRHGPYYYLSVTRRVGKTELFYVRAEQVDRVRRGIAAYRRGMKVLQELAELNRAALGIGGRRW